jgi:hypothetical protein
MKRRKGVAFRETVFLKPAKDPCTGTDAAPSQQLFGLPFDPFLQESDFLLLRGDDLLCQLADLEAFAVLQDHPRHIDSALVVRDHAARKIKIGISGIRAAHIPVHLLARGPVALDSWAFSHRRRSGLMAVVRSLLSHRDTREG